MPIVSVTSDPVALTLTAIGEYPVPVERLWAAWADPRQLERFWGPPQWPSTFTRHELSPGGRSDYAMTGPNGEVARGCWEIDVADPTRTIVLRDRFCHEDGTPNLEMPESHMRMTFEATQRGSRFVSVTTFPNVEAMERLLAMGMVEGLTEALGQMDEVLADLRDLSKGFATDLVVEDDTHALVTREVRGRIDLVWRAHHEPALVQRWMLGPDGWSMPVCDVATEIGQSYRYEWQKGEERFGFTGELLESEAPRRAVTTERMIGMPGPATRNELMLTPRPGNRTKITLRITYPSREVRDMVLGTGMVDGMEASYSRLEQVIG